MTSATPSHKTHTISFCISGRAGVCSSSGASSLLLAVYLLEAWSRFRRTTIEGRHLIFWAGSLWFVFVINSLTGIILTRPDLLLIFWILMLLPMIVDTSGKRVAT